MGKFIILLIIIIISSITITFEPKEQQPEKSDFEQNCQFYKKITGGDLVIEETKSGTYHYEVFAASDGIEVYKCK